MDGVATGTKDSHNTRLPRYSHRVSVITGANQMKTSPCRAAALILSSALLVAACGKAPPAGPAAEAAAQKAVEATRVEIVVTLTEGKVELLDDSLSPRLLGPGDAVLQGQTLRTGPGSSCDLDIGGMGQLRIQADTSLKIELARFLSGSPAFRSTVLGGRVMAVARKLSAKESFMISTGNAVCGVRGTSFSVQSEGGKSLVVVAEGRVAVLPAGPALARLEKAAATSQAARGLLRAAVALAPVAGPGEELAVGPAEARKADSALAALEAALPGSAGEVQGTEEPAPEPLMPADTIGDAAAQAQDLPGLSAALPKASPAGAASRLVLEALKEFASGAEKRIEDRTGGLPVAPVPAKPGAAQSPAVLASLPAFPGRPVDSLIRSGSSIVATDTAGAIVCIGSTGKVLWRLPVEKGNHPVLSKGYLYVAGASGFLVVDAASGALSRGPALPAGARLAAFPDGVAAASTSGISLFRSGSAVAWTTFTVDGGPLAITSLNDKENSLLVSLMAGGLAVISPGTASIALVAPGPVASCLRYYDTRAVAAGARTGDPSTYELAFYALPGLEFLWSVGLDFRPTDDPELGPEGAFVFGQGRLAAFSPSGGVIGAVSGLSAPPLLSNGMLYYGLADGSFVAALASDLTLKASIRLRAPLAARPIPFDGELRLPLADGTVLSVDPRLMGK